MLRLLVPCPRTAGGWRSGSSRLLTGQIIDQLLVFLREFQQPSADARLRLHHRDFSEALDLLTVADDPKGHPDSTIRTGKLLVNLDRRIVTIDDQPLHLTGKEYAIFELLSLRKGTALTKEMILNHLYGGMDEPELKIIDVFICKLRKKLVQATNGENYIETVWGRGYALRDPEGSDAGSPPLSQARAA
jgi:DNA-binding response OmpR family regulator